MEMNNFNVQINDIGNNEYGIKILDEKYLNLVFKYDKLNVVDDLLEFEIKILQNPNNYSEELLNSDEFVSYCSDLLLQILNNAMEYYKLNDIREHNSEELSKE